MTKQQQLATVLASLDEPHLRVVLAEAERLAPTEPQQPDAEQKAWLARLWSAVADWVAANDGVV